MFSLTVQYIYILLKFLISYLIDSWRTGLAFESQVELYHFVTYWLTLVARTERQTKVHNIQLKTSWKLSPGLESSAPCLILDRFATQSINWIHVTPQSTNR